jgi:cytochrome c-type biogenesis protein CcmE
MRAYSLRHRLPAPAKAFIKGAMKKQSNRAAYLVALLLFVSGIGYLAFTGFTEGRMPYIDVAELLAAPQGSINKAKLFGTVSPVDLRRKADGLGAEFVLLDKNNADQSVVVDYKGVLPDLFGEGAEVIVEGQLVENRLFKASFLSTKCPSKYEKANREENT